MSQWGHDHFQGDGWGGYQLSDREFSRPVYLRLKDAYPRFFPIGQSASVEESIPKYAARIGKTSSGRPQKDVSTKSQLKKARVAFDVEKLSNQLIADEVTQFFEGKKIRIFVNAYERDRIAREQCVARQGYSCSVCEMNFEETYGELGIGFIHVHHLYPFSVHDAPRETNPDEDLRPVCPNCHAMLHKGEKGVLSIHELRERWRNAKQRKRRAEARNRRKRAK